MIAVDFFSTPSDNDKSKCLSLSTPTSLKVAANTVGEFILDGIHELKFRRTYKIKSSNKVDYHIDNRGVLIFDNGECSIDFNSLLKFIRENDSICEEIKFRLADKLEFTGLDVITYLSQIIELEHFIINNFDKYTIRLEKLESLYLNNLINQCTAKFKDIWKLSFPKNIIDIKIIEDTTVSLSSSFLFELDNNLFLTPTKNVYGSDIAIWGVSIAEELLLTLYYLANAE